MPNSSSEENQSNLKGNLNGVIKCCDELTILPRGIPERSNETAFTVKKNNKKVAISAMVDNPLYIPKREQNLVITKLMENNLLLRTQNKVGHKLICPWKHEHKDPRSAVADYFEPNPKIRNPKGAFKCPNDVCKSRNVHDLCQFLGVNDKEAKNRPTIRLHDDRLSEIVDLCEQELANSGIVYQRDNLIVTIYKDKNLNNVSIQEISLSIIVRVLSRFVNFEKYDKRSLKWISCDPPERHCRTLFGARDYPHLPVLRGIVRQPYLCRKGSLVNQPGYDKDTGFYSLFIRRFRIPNKPSKPDAGFALHELDNLLKEFNFKTPHDRSAALAAFLTATIRPSLPLAPMFHCRAPQSAVGKSYLTFLISAFATAAVGLGTPFPANDEECRKLLMASLLTSPPVLCFDNMDSDLVPHKTLCSALTEEYIKDRKLGVTKTATASTRTLFLSNGNNVGPIRDMCRRAITINLDPACEVPTARTFNSDPLPIVLSQREHFVSLALTIIRAWIVAGSPLADVKHLATYKDWSNLCRQPLIWLGCPDPAESIFLSLHHDPDRETLGRLLHAWYDLFESRPTMIRVAISTGDDALSEAFMEIAGYRGGLNKKKLGSWISRHANRIVDGLRFEKDSGTRSAETWRVESVSEHPDTNNVEHAKSEK